MIRCPKCNVALAGRASIDGARTECNSCGFEFKPPKFSRGDRVQVGGTGDWLIEEVYALQEDTWLYRASSSTDEGSTERLVREDESELIVPRDFPYCTCPSCKVKLKFILVQE